MEVYKHSNVIKTACIQETIAATQFQYCHDINLNEQQNKHYQQAKLQHHHHDDCGLYAQWKNHNAEDTTQYATQSHQARSLLGQEHQYITPEQAQEYHQYELLDLYSSVEQFTSYNELNL